MELQLFGPVPTKMLVAIYGTTLERVREGDESESTQLRLNRLKAELNKLGVPVKTLPGVRLSKEKEDELQRRFASCYENTVRNMTWSEMIMDYNKFSCYGFDAAADLIKDEMLRRGCMTEGAKDEVVIDSLCSLSDRIAMGATMGA